MDRLKQALEEALKRNEDQTERWKKYLEDIQHGVENLKEFSKSLQVEAMVPVGSKAFIPGYLYHTSEVFVSHFCGYFSKCSTIQAQELMQHRIELANKRLDDLDKEREMFKNKLEVPFVSGALPSEDLENILEEVSEEEHKRWVESHKKSVQKQRKRISNKQEEPTNEDKSHEECMARLEELELMEELEDELDELEIDDDEILRKLLTGEITLESEKRRAMLEQKDSSDDEVEIEKPVKAAPTPAKPIEEQSNKEPELDKSKNALESKIEQLPREVIYELIEEVSSALSSKNNVLQKDEGAAEQIQEDSKSVEENNVKESKSNQERENETESKNATSVCDTPTESDELQNDYESELDRSNLEFETSIQQLSPEELDNIMEGVSNAIDSKNDILEKQENAFEQVVTEHESQLPQEVENVDKDKTGKRSLEIFITKQSDTNQTDNVNFTNNNTEENVEDFISEDVSEEEKHPEILKMEADTVNFSNQKKLEYFKNQLKVYEQREVMVKSPADIDRKLKLLEIVDYLQDSVEVLKELVDEEKKGPKKKAEKKRIHFAEEDEVYLIDSRKEPNFKEQKKDYIEKITFGKNEVPAPAPAPVVPINRRETILEKVEQNIELVCETQSQEDFDLVGKIIGSEVNKCKTLYLHFDHSNNRFVSPGYTVNGDEDDKTIGSPADIYKAFPHYFNPDAADSSMSFGHNVNFQVQPSSTEDKSEEKVKAKDSSATKIRFSSDDVTANVTNNKAATTEEQLKPQNKSILKNKDSVKQEKHVKLEGEHNKENSDRKPKPKKKQQIQHNLIMGDVVERPEEPDPLPKEKFIDTHAPKKRISRFKEARLNAL